MALKRPASARRSNPVRQRPREETTDDDDVVDKKNASDKGDLQPESGSDTSSDDNTSSSSGGSGDRDDDPSASEATSMEEEVEVDIELFNPKAEDFHGIKALVEGLLGGAAFNVSSLADAVIAQNVVGTVIKSGEDEQPIGVTSLLNVERYQDLEAMQQIKAHLISCSDAVSRELLLPALEDPGTGLLLNERVINCPPQIGPPVMKALFDEIEWALQDETTPETRESFRIKQFLIIAPAFVDPLAQTTSETKKAASKKASHKRAKVDLEQQIVYIKPDDEYFHRNAKCSFTFASPKPPGVEIDASELQPLRLVMLVTAEGAAIARRELDEAIERVEGQPKDEPEQ